MRFVLKPPEPCVALRRCPRFTLCFLLLSLPPPRATVNFRKVFIFQNTKLKRQAQGSRKETQRLEFRDRAHATQDILNTLPETIITVRTWARIERGQLSPQTPSTLPCETTLVEPVSLINAPVPAHSFHVPQRPITVSVPERSFCETHTCRHRLLPSTRMTRWVGGSSSPSRGSKQLSSSVSHSICFFYGGGCKCQRTRSCYLNVIRATQINMQGPYRP